LARWLVLVCAPAGSGKTSLLADWAAATRRPPAPPSFEGLVTALVNELAAQPGEVPLVVDDYQLIDARPVHASLGFLLEHRPPGLRLVLASRADPPLPLARPRARGQLAELRQADLRFTAGEAAALLGAALGTEPPAAAVTALEDRTEGWPAGLQQAALSLRGHRDPAGFVAGFSGSHRHVLDYLAEEVLDGQPPELRGFLLETSVLERLCGGLCDALTGRADGQAMQERVERAGLFLTRWTTSGAGGATTTCSPTGRAHGRPPRPAGRGPAERRRRPRGRPGLPGPAPGAFDAGPGAPAPPRLVEPLPSRLKLGLL
jgi:LuxR family maltose regulon positive regulatory protein